MRVDKEWNVLAEDRISVDLVQRKDVLKVRKNARFTYWTTGTFRVQRRNALRYAQKVNSVIDCECCCYEQPISTQNFFLLQFHRMLTTTTFTFQHKIQLLVTC